MQEEEKKSIKIRCKKKGEDGCQGRDGTNEPEALQGESDHHKTKREAEKKGTSSPAREPSLVISITSQVRLTTTIITNIITTR